MAILVGGQPGAGKTALARQALTEMRERGGAVLIDADRMRENLPQYGRLLREQPQHAADLTQADAGRWSVALTTAAALAHRNLVIDGTMRNPENLRNLARRLGERGYTLEVRGVAMPADVSLTRAQLRTEREIATTGVGRVVNADQHDQAYAGMLETVALLEREKAVHRIQIVDRRHQEVYRNELEHGEWRKSPAAAAAISRERDRPMTHEELSVHAQTLGDILAMRTVRGAPAAEIADVSERRENALAARQQAGQAIADRAPAQSEVAGPAEPVRATRQREIDHSRDIERGRAFDTLSRDQALALFPELDGAYQCARDVRDDRDVPGLCDQSDLLPADATHVSRDRRRAVRQARSSAMTTTLSPFSRALEARVNYAYAIYTTDAGSVAWFAFMETARQHALALGRVRALDLTDDCDCPNLLADVPTLRLAFEAAVQQVREGMATSIAVVAVDRAA